MGREGWAQRVAVEMCDRLACTRGLIASLPPPWLGAIRAQGSGGHFTASSMPDSIVLKVAPCNPQDGVKCIMRHRQSGPEGA